MKEHMPDLSTGTIYPASGLQILNWHHQEKIDQGKSSFQEPEVLSLNLKFKELDFSAFEEAYRALIKRHESLRATFLMISGQLMQRIARYQPYYYDVDIFDISSSVVKDNFIKEQTKVAINIVSDLEKGPLIKSLLFKTGPKESWFISIIHHIISDAHSLDILRNEFIELYRYFKYGRPYSFSLTAGSISTLIQRQNDFVSGISGEKEFLFWSAKFRKFSTINFENLHNNCKAALFDNNAANDNLNDLDMKRFVTGNPVKGANTFRFFLSPQLSKPINQTATAIKITPFVFMAASFCILLHLLNGQKKYLLATSINARRTLQSRNIVGHLMYKIYLDIFSGDNDTVVDFLTKVYNTFLRNSRHPIYQEKQYEEMNIPQFTSLYINYSDLRNMEMSGNNQPVGIHEKANRSCYLLSTVINNYSNCIEINWLYDLDVFTPRMIEFMSDQYNSIVKEILANRNNTVQQLVTRVRQSF